MKHERATEELRELAALYALGSLTQHEARSFELHLKEGCSICESEFRRFERAVVGVGFAAREVPVPEYIRDLLIARIEREPQTPKASGPSELTEKKPAREDFMRPSPAALSLLSQPRREGSAIFPWVLVVLLVALGAFILYAWWSENDANIQLQAKASAAQADVDQLRGELEAQRRKAEGYDQILATSGKAGMRMSRLAIQTSPASSLAIIWDTEKSHCLVMGSFSPAPPGKRYQLWFFTPAAKVPVGQLEVSGFPTVLRIAVPAEAASASAAVVTIEPDNGSQIPTSPYYAVGRID